MSVGMERFLFMVRAFMNSPARLPNILNWMMVMIKITTNSTHDIAEA